MNPTRRSPPLVEHERPSSACAPCGPVSAHLARGLFAAWLVCAVPACGFWNDSVVRIYEGRRVQGDEIESSAYAAGLAAAMAEARGDYAVEVDWLRRALQDGEDDGLRARLGRALCRASQPEAAMTEFETVLRHDPESEAAYSFRAECLAARGNVTAATVDRRRAVAADPDAVDAAVAWIDRHIQDDAHGARLRSEELVLRHPASATAWAALFRVCLATADLVGAARALERVAKLDEQQGRVLHAQWAPRIRIAGIPVPSISAHRLQTSRRVIHSPAAAPNTDQRLAKTESLGAERCTGLAQQAMPVLTTEERTLAFDLFRLRCPAEVPRLDELESHTAAPDPSPHVSAHLRSSTSLEARARGERLRLRWLSTGAAIEAVRASSETTTSATLTTVQPREEARFRRALYLAHDAHQRAVARDAQGFDLRASRATNLAPAEPTVARLLASAARELGRDEQDPHRRRACALAVTPEEVRDCRLP